MEQPVNSTTWRSGCVAKRPTAFSYEQLNPLADGLTADGAGLQRGAALDAGGVSALEDQFDVVVDADRAGDPLLHLPVARLQLLQQVVLLRVLRAGAAIHFGLVCEGQGGKCERSHRDLRQHRSLV